MWVYLHGGKDLIRDRLRRRTDHVLKADLLASQFEALEEPSDAIVVGISPSPEIIVAEIAAALASRRAIHVFTDPAALAWHAAEATVAVIDEAVRRRGRCSLVLSGGTTPRPLYELLATRFRDRVPWHGVHMFWGDERYVPHAHRDSNYGMAREALLDRVPCVPGNVHPVLTHGAHPAEAARDYDRVLRAFFAGGVPAFDLALLGMGPDGHTASLFPGSSALHDWTSLVRAVESAADPPLRVTMTFAALTHAAASYVLVTGSEKAAAVRRCCRVAPGSTSFRRWAFSRRQDFRGRGGVLLSQRELPLQVLDLARLIGQSLRALFQLLTQPLVFAPQSLQLLRAGIRRPSIASPWLGWPERTELRHEVQEA